MKNSKLIFSFCFVFVVMLQLLKATDVELKYDNGSYKGNSYSSAVAWWEESAYLQPDGPCKIKKVMIYYSGTQSAKDTVHFVGYPIAGNLYPTHYVWNHNSFIAPVIVDYDGTPGWKEIDVSNSGLKSDGFDKIVIQHYIKPIGPWFGYDNDGKNPSNLSWMTDPYTPNPNFYNIAGTIYSYPPGDYMIRFIVEYDFPDGNTTQPPPPPVLVDVSAVAGISGGGYASIVDWNNDGWDDIAMGGTFFENQKDGTFKNVTSQFNIPGASGTSWADIDNDGWIDFYAMRNGAQDWNKHMVWSGDKVYKNNGNGTFTEFNNKVLFKTPYPEPGVDFSLGANSNNDSLPNPYPAISPLWFDYNNDGWLDLFIANRRIEVSGQEEIWCPDQLWKNNKDGSFSNVRASSKISDGEPRLYWPGQGYYDCYGAAACDYNLDNKADLFVANYRLIKDNLYKNQGDGTFLEVGAETGTQGVPTALSYYFGHGMGCMWGDFNNDGLPDLAVGNLAHTDSRGAYSNSSLIFQNLGAPDYKFREVHNEMSLKFHEGNAGMLWLDLNLDGLLDLWHGIYSGGMNWIYLNQGPPNYKLKDITWLSGAYAMNAWSAVYIDYDHDGDLDLLINGKLYRNDMKHQGNWIAVRLLGNMSENVHPQAYGSKVTVYAGGKLFYRDLMGSVAGTLCTQNSSELHFGIGNASVIDSIVVTYPNGMKNKLLNVKPNARYTIPYMANAEFNGLAVPALEYPLNFTTKLAPELTLLWTALGNADNYTLQMSDKQDFSNIISENKNVSVNSFDLTSLTNNKTYFWRVRAFSAQDSSQWSTVWNFSVGLPMPSKPLLKTPRNDSLNISAKPTLNWNESNYNGVLVSKTNYQLQVSASSSFTSNVIDTTMLNTLTFVFKQTLTPGTKFYWRVRAINETLNGEWSDVWSFSVMPVPLAPVLTTPPNNAKDIVLKPTLYWEASVNARYYLLQISKTENFADTLYGFADLTATSRRMFQSLTSETKYFWRVKAFNEGGQGDWSDVFNFTTLKSSPVLEISQSVFNIANSPNPFSGITSIEFVLPENSFVSVEIFDGRGVLTETLISAQLEKGNHLLKWDARKCSSGDYYCRIKTELISETLKIVVLK